MKTYTPWEAFTPEQAQKLNWTEDFITQYGTSVNELILEAMRTEYPDDNTRILERKHFWDVQYVLETERRWSKFNSQLGISTSGKDWSAIRVYPIWASYPQRFHAPQESWKWNMENLANHLYSVRDTNKDSVSEQEIDRLLGIQGVPRLIHDKMIARIQQKIEELKVNWL